MMPRTFGCPKWRIMGIATLSFICIQWLYSIWIYPSTSYPFRAPKPSFASFHQDETNFFNSVLTVKHKKSTDSERTSVIASSQGNGVNKKENKFISPTSDIEFSTQVPLVLYNSELSSTTVSAKKIVTDTPKTVYLLYLEQQKRCDEDSLNAHHLCNKNAKGRMEKHGMANKRLEEGYPEAYKIPSKSHREENVRKHEGEQVLLQTEVKHQEPQLPNTNVAFNSIADYGLGNTEENENWDSVMDERRKRVQNICGQNRSVLRRFMNHERLLFDTKHNIAYCRNAKAGTTTWLSYLLDASGISSLNMNPDEIHEVVAKVFPSLPPKTAAEEMKHNPLLFTVVRHPFTRLVSAYRDKIPENYRKDLQEQIISKYRNKTATQSTTYIDDGGLQDTSQPSFREFALFVSDQILACDLIMNSACLSQVDAHWRPIYDRCAPCDLHYDVIAKVETFDIDEKYIRNLSGLSTASNIVKLRELTREHASTGPSSVELARLYFSLLTPGEKQKIYEAYYFDFVLFGYSPTDIT